MDYPPVPPEPMIWVIHRAKNQRRRLKAVDFNPVIHDLVSIIDSESAEVLKANGHKPPAGAAQPNGQDRQALLAATVRGFEKKPSVAALMRAAGVWRVTAAERDAVWEQVHGPDR